MPKTFTVRDLEEAIGRHNRVLKKHHTEFRLSRGKGRKKPIILKIHYAYGSKSKTRTLAEGFSARETEMIAQAAKDGFTFYSNKTK